jgi:DNA-binding transcriptional LysR family regulator
MEWDDARYVLAIHRESSLSQAAHKLGVNQSTVGRRLEAIEEALGARLFFRTRDGYVLTPEGETLVPHAERMEDAAHAIQREIGGREAQLSGTVRITGPDPFSARILMPALAQLHARYPNIDLELVADNRALSLTKREADIAVRIGLRAEPQLVVRKVATVAFGVYASPLYLAARGRPKPPDFDGHTFIADEPMAGPADGAWLAYRGASTRTIFRSQSTLACLEAAAIGMGIALLPCYLGDTEPRLERIGEATPPAPVLLLLHPDLQHASRIRACCDALVASIQSQANLLLGQRARAPASDAAIADLSGRRPPTVAPR